MNQYHGTNKLARAASVLIGALILISIASPVGAANTLSPALDIIAKDFTMAKSGLVGTEIHFEKEDFTTSLGIDRVGKITIASLPESSTGRLQLGSRYVEVGQTISEGNLDKLKFIQHGNGEVSATFSFTRGSDPYGTAYACTIYTLMSVNTAPSVILPDSEEAFSGEPSAYSGVAYLGTIRAKDSEGDPLSFEIIHGTSNGTVRLTDKSHGYYEYTANKSFTGKDSFTVRVTDKYGNRSGLARITLRVDAPQADEVFADMDGHWANSAVISCVREGIIAAPTNGEMFYPDEYISRAEFLSIAMNTAGYTGFSVSGTGFVDDAEIPEEYKGCIAAAQALGIIDGVESADGMRFYPNNQITRSEAAVILSRLTGITGGTVAVFAGSEAIPSWAQGAMAGLYNAGILRGSGDGTLGAYTPLTRGAAVQMVSGIISR